MCSNQAKLPAATPIISAEAVSKGAASAPFSVVPASVSPQRKPAIDKSVEIPPTMMSPQIAMPGTADGDEFWSVVGTRTLLTEHPHSVG